MDLQLAGGDLLHLLPMVQSQSLACTIHPPAYIPSLHLPSLQQSHQKAFTPIRLTAWPEPGNSGHGMWQLSTEPAADPVATRDLLLPVLEEAAKPEGNKLENRFQDKDNGEDVIANLQGFVKNLGWEHRTGVRC